MSGRPIQPRGTSGGPLTPWYVLGLAWTILAGGWLLWLGGQLAALLTGHAWTSGPSVGTAATALLHGHTAALWPGTPRWLIATMDVLLLGGAVGSVVAGWVGWQAHRPDADDPLPALAGPRDVAPLTHTGVAARAARLRPSLTSTPTDATLIDAIPAEQAGVLLGTLRQRAGIRHLATAALTRQRHRQRRPGLRLYASWEDVIVAIMAPRAGKTTALTVPAVLNAPGPVVATSNKPDLWATTAEARAAVPGGRVWLFDPQAVTHQPQTWWYDPLAALTSFEDAFRLADHFVQQIRTAGKTGEDFWIMAAHDLLTGLLLAAACDQGTLHDVQRWLADVQAREPAQILRTHGYHAAARALHGRQAGAPETRDGVYETARTAAACLQDPQIMAWVTPPGRAMSRLDVTTFPGSHHTLYLLSKDGAGAAAPLVAGLTDQVVRAGVRAAEAAGGRLDPVLLAVLDEAANICKISDLPQLYSHLGSRGIVPLTILQSYPQGTGVWGEHGMAALWSAATVKLVGAGIDDARFAEDISRLVGEHDVTVASHTRDGTGHTSWQTATRRQRILDPAQIRALPRGTALLLATGIRPALLDLLYWYQGDQAATLTSAVDRATGAVTRHARSRAHQPDRSGGPQ